MAASQEQRYALYDKIRDAWGDQYATAFIEIVPPMDADQIATKQDLEHMAIQLRSEMADLRGELLREMGALRGEFGELQGGLRGDFGELQGGLRGDFGELQGGLRGDFGKLRGEFEALRRQLSVTMLGGLLTIWLTVVVPQLL